MIEPDDLDENPAAGDVDPTELLYTAAPDSEGTLAAWYSLASVTASARSSTRHCPRPGISLLALPWEDPEPRAVTARHGPAGPPGRNRVVSPTG